MGSKTAEKPALSVLSGPLQDLLDFYLRADIKHRRRTCESALGVFNRYQDRLKISWQDFMYDLSTHEGDLASLRASYSNQVDTGRTGQDVYDYFDMVLFSELEEQERDQD